MRRGWSVAFAVLALGAASCAPQPTPSGQPGGPTPTPVAVDGGPTATPTAAEPMTSSSNGATLTVTPRSSSVAAGGVWTVDVELHNGRNVPLIYSRGPCGGFATYAMSVPIPLEPDGAAWSGIEAAFKAYALTQGRAAGGAPATDPVVQYFYDSSCPEPAGGFVELAPGESARDSLEWRAELIPDVDALPGPVGFEITGGIDPDRTEPPPPDPGGGPIGGWWPVYTSLGVRGQLTVDQPRQDPISIGQAIDALLGDSRFTEWLAVQPAGTCTGVNVLLTTGQAGSFIAPGPQWAIDVFCEAGVPRHFIIATVDPFTAEVTGFNRCDVPCDR